MSVVEQSVSAEVRTPPALPWGVRALAEELPGSHAARSLACLADRLEKGESWQAALNDPEVRLPEHVRGLLQASLKTNNVPQTLEQFAHLSRRSTQLRREMFLSVAYPLTVTVSVVVLFACFEYFVVAELARLYEAIFLDFGTVNSTLRMPAMTQLMIAWSGPPAVTLMVLVIVLGVVLPAIWYRWRPLWLDVVMHRVPLLGPLWLWAGMVDLCRLLALLLESGIPLPEALRMTGAGLASSELAQACRRLARRVESGQSLADSIAVTSPLPDTLGPVAEWGETRSALPSALQAAAEMYEGRVHVQLAFVRLFMPPAVFLFAGGVIFLSLLAVFLPMFILLKSFM